MTDIERIPVPATPPATIRRKMPEPFTRPRLVIGGPDGPKREWRTIPAYDLSIGDIVPGVGRLYKVDETTYLPEGRWVVEVEGGLDNRRSFGGEELVFAYAPESAR